jgi:hypothetical protein
MSTNSTSPAASDLSKKWWLWPLVPFAFAGAAVGILTIFIIVAVVAPFAMIAERRKRKLAKRKLVEEGRYIDLNEAMDRYALGSYLFIAELTKNDKNIWLIPVSSEDYECFAALPTYHEFKIDTRSVVENLLKLDQDTMSKLVPSLQKAIRIEASLEQLLDESSELVDSVSMLYVLQRESPTKCLYEQINPKKQDHS